MARTFTLGALVTRAKQICDMENQSTISDNEWKGYYSTAYGEFYGILVASGMRYFESVQTITADGSATYALPAAHLATIGVDYVVSAASGERRQLYELMAQERNVTSGVTASEARYYALIGQNIRLYPTPSSGTYEHVYVPQPTDLSSSADGTSVDVVTPDGESFLIWHVAVNAKTKEESDVAGALNERERARQRLEEWAVERSLNTPRRPVVEVGPDFGQWPYDEGDYSRSRLW